MRDINLLTGSTRDRKWGRDGEAGEGFSSAFLCFSGKGLNCGTRVAARNE